MLEASPALEVCKLDGKFDEAEEEQDVEWVMELRSNSSQTTPS